MVGKKAEYNLEISPNVKFEELAKSIGIFEAAEFILKAKPYTGRFTVYNNGHLEKGFASGLEKKIAVLNLTEPSNFEAINRKNYSKPVHAHFENNGKAIDYTPKQIKKCNYFEKDFKS